MRTFNATARAAAAGLALSGAVMLAGCGQSTEAKREQVIRCTGFSIALTKSDDTSGVRNDAEALLNKDGITANDTVPMGAAATQYATGMDPARVTHLSQDGALAAQDLISKKDAPGIANYMKVCVATFRSLGK